MGVYIDKKDNKSNNTSIIVSSSMPRKLNNVLNNTTSEVIINDSYTEDNDRNINAIPNVNGNNVNANTKDKHTRINRMTNHKGLYKHLTYNVDNYYYKNGIKSYNRFNCDSNNKLNIPSTVSKADDTRSLSNKKKCPRKMSLINIPNTTIKRKTYTNNCCSNKSLRAVTPQSIKSCSRLKSNNNSKKHFDNLFNDIMIKYSTSNNKGVSIAKKVNNTTNKKVMKPIDKTNLFYVTAFSKRNLHKE